MTENKIEKLSPLDELRKSQDESLPKGGNGSSTSRCFKVQARVSKGCQPKRIKNQSDHSWFGTDTVLTDSHWTTLDFPEGPVGVPRSSFNDEFARYGFLSFQAAQALRWWFLAEQGGLSFIETRLIEFEFKHTHSAEPVKAHCLVDPSQREDIMPDWGKWRKYREGSRQDYKLPL